MQTAMPNTKAQITPPLTDSITCRNRASSSPPNWLSMAVSNASMDTSAAVKLMALAADRAGLPCLRNYTRLTAAVMIA